MLLQINRLFIKNSPWLSDFLHFFRLLLRLGLLLFHSEHVVWCAEQINETFRSMRVSLDFLVKCFAFLFHCLTARLQGIFYVQVAGVELAGLFIIGHFFLLIHNHDYVFPLGCGWEASTLN